MPSSQPTTAGIITDETGTRQIPASTRADGSTRRAIKIRPGYQPPEDVALYKNRTAENFRNRYKGGVPGAESVKDETAAPAATAAAAATGRVVPGASSAPGGSSSATTAANKNAKRREARKKAAAAATGTTDDRTPAPAATAVSAKEKGDQEKQEKPAEPTADPQAEREKKARGLRKKLKQARELQSKKDGGATLLPEQIAKVIRIHELIRELEALGLDANEPEAAGEAGGSGNTTT